jgi:hypothetical protein
MAIYIKNTKLKASKYGIKFSGKTEDFIAQIKAITNDKGYFNLEIKERKEVGQYGDTHSLTVDEWTPEQSRVVKADYITAPKDGTDLPF